MLNLSISLLPQWETFVCHPWVGHGSTVCRPCHWCWLDHSFIFCTVHAAGVMSQDPLYLVSSDHVRLGWCLNLLGCQSVRPNLIQIHSCSHWFDCSLQLLLCLAYVHTFHTCISLNFDHTWQLYTAMCHWHVHHHSDSCIFTEYIMIFCSKWVQFYHL
jgi:hypothetical protein